MANDLPEPVAPPVALTGLPAMRALIDSLDRQREALTEAGEVELLAHGGSDLAALIADLRALLRAVQSDLARLVTERHTGRGKPRLEVDGLGVVEVESGSDYRQWESHRLLRKLVYGVLVTPDGELVDRHPLDSAAEIVEVLCECLPIGPSTAWRRGQRDPATNQWSGLRGRGIDPDEYAEKIAKPRLAKLPKREST